MVQTITEPYGSVAEVAFWPLLLLLAFLAWRFRANRIVRVGCVLSALAIVLTGMFHDLFSGNASLATLHDFEVAQCIVFVPFLILFAGMVLETAKDGWKKEDRFSSLFVTGAVLLSFWGIVSAIVLLIKDLALPWYVVDGEVTSLESTWRPWGDIPWKALGPNFIRIGDTQVQASTPLYRTLRVGQHVRVEVSRGSDFIRRIERVRPGAQLDRSNPALPKPRG